MNTVLRISASVKLRYNTLAMHELSIAQNLVEVASAAAQEARAVRVTAVHVRLGALSGVVKEALLFGWDVVTQDTLLAGARLEIEELPVIVHCPHCERDVPLPSVQRFRCPLCDTPTPYVVQGKEIELRSLEIMDEPAYS